METLPKEFQTCGNKSKLDFEPQQKNKDIGFGGPGGCPLDPDRDLVGNDPHWLQFQSSDSDPIQVNNDFPRGHTKNLKGPPSNAG